MDQSAPVVLMLLSNDPPRPDLTTLAVAVRREIDGDGGATREETVT
jgi:hypothetical protein